MTQGIVIVNNGGNLLVRQSSPAPTIVRSTNVVAVMEPGMQGPPGIQGPPGASSGPTTFTATALTAMTYPSVVAVVAGAAHLADPTNYTDMVSQLAITTQAAAAGATVTCATQTSITEPAWSWSPGRVYLAPAGGLTQTPGATGAVLEVGRAITPTTIEFDIQTAILR